MTHTEDAFLSRACTAFNLGRPEAVARLPSASANRTWRLVASSGTTLVKEFRYPPSDLAWVRALEAATDFEWAVWSGGEVEMPAPLRSGSGRVVESMLGSRGRPALVRVHAWSYDPPLPPMASADITSAAGAQLALVQSIGARYRRSATGSLRWWSWDPVARLYDLRKRGFVTSSDTARFHSVLVDALELARLGESAEDWSFCHFDHKPDNILLAGERLVLVDWDEAALCPPRCEVAEAALLWAASSNDGPDRRRLTAFLGGYNSAGGSFDKPTAVDFAKWAASRAGWFDYLALRVLGLVNGSAREADEALTMAMATLQDAADGLREVDTWARWMA